MIYTTNIFFGREERNEKAEVGGPLSLGRTGSSRPNWDLALFGRPLSPGAMAMNNNLYFIIIIIGTSYF